MHYELCLTLQESGSVALYCPLVPCYRTVHHFDLFAKDDVWTMRALDVFPVHEGGRQDIDRWDQHTIAALVEGNSTLRLLTYDLRGTASTPTAQHLISDEAHKSAGFDMAGSTAAIAWRVGADGGQPGAHCMQLWDVRNGRLMAQLDAEGQQQRMDGLQPHQRHKFCLTDDGRTVLVRDNFGHDISVWARRDAYDDNCAILRNTSVMCPSTQHGVPYRERDIIHAMDCAETLLVTLTDHNGWGALRFAMFGEGPRPALVNEDEEDEEDDEEEQDASDNDEN